LVSVPEVIHIRMVDASALSDYEMWLFLASVLSTAGVGFLVATVQAFDSQPPKAGATQLICTTVVWTVLFIAAITKAYFIRRALRKGGKSIALKTTAAIDET